MFIAKTRILCAAVLAMLTAGACGQPVPAEFVHNRIYVVAKLPDGSPLRFATDSGGGWNAIDAAAAGKLGLVSIGEMEVEGRKRPVFGFPEALKRAGIPAPSRDPWFDGRLVMADKREMMGADGFLGTRWFAERIWRIDYPKQTLTVEPEWKPMAGERTMPMGFQTDSGGQRALNFPRVTITVDDRPIDVLLDTGATATLTEAAAAEFKLKPGTQVATSFVVRSIYDEWRKRHPDWKVIERADALGGGTFPMIEVPRVTMAGISFGPVWFTMRRDMDFREWMSQSMDQPIDGAIGGSGLQYLHLVLDYPRALAHVSVGLGATLK